MANYNVYHIKNRTTNDISIPRYGTKAEVVTERILDTETGEVTYKEVAQETRVATGYWTIPGSHPEKAATEPRHLEIQGKEEYDEFMQSPEVRNLTVNLGWLSTEKVNT